MMFNPRFIVVLCVLIGSVCLVGCDGQDSQAKGDKAGDEKAQVEAPTASDSPESEDSKPAKSGDELPDEPAGAKAPPEKLDGPMKAEDPGEGVEILAFGDELPEGVERDGKLLKGVRWKDKSGENILVFFHVQRSVDEELLRVDHLRKTNGEWSLVEDYRELAKNCQGADLVMETYIDEEWFLTDYDEDDHGEVTFAYSVGCLTDLSPVTHKVLLVEEGKKYALRGETAVRVSEQKVVGGKYENEDDFEGAPEEFLDKAFRTWRFTVY